MNQKGHLKEEGLKKILKRKILMNGLETLNTGHEVK